MRYLLLCLLLIGAALPLHAINIEAVRFTGSENLDQSALLAASGLKLGQAYDSDAMEAVRERLYDYMQSVGRYFVVVKAPELIPIDAENLQLVFAINELIPSTGAVLVLQGMQYFSADKLRQLLLLSGSTVYPLKSIPATMQRILSMYHDRGYLFAKVQLDSLVQAGELTAYIGINEGKPMRVKEYIFRGNKTTRNKTLLNLSGLSQAKTVTPTVLSQAEENILSKSYIRDCVVEPIDDSSILIRVEEGRMTFLEGVLGASSISGNLKLSGQLRLQFQNLWGSDRAIKLFWKKLAVANSELSISYHDSGVPGIPIAGDIMLQRLEQDSTWVNSSATLEVYYRMQKWDTGLEFTAQSISPGSRRPSTIEASQTNSIGAFWKLKSLEGGMNPYRGINLDVRYRLNNPSEGSIYGATEFSGQGYIPIGNRFVGSLGLNIRNLENKTPALWEVYHMGGYNSLRGYSEDEFSSFRLAWMNYELRYRLSPDSRIYFLFDQGFLGKQNNRLEYDKFGLGLGMKIKTRLGILGIEYALGYRDKRLSSLGSGMIHAGLDASF